MVQIVLGAGHTRVNEQTGLHLWTTYTSMEGRGIHQMNTNFALVEHYTGALGNLDPDQEGPKDLLRSGLILVEGRRGNSTCRDTRILHNPQKKRENSPLTATRPRR